MFVRWKKKPISGRYWDPDCPHTGPGRYSLTPVVVRSVRTGTKVKQEVVCRPAGPIKSCCLEDPIVRARWWRETKRHLRRAQVDRDWLIEQLQRVVPALTLEEESLFGLWEHNRPDGSCDAEIHFAQRTQKLHELADEVRLEISEGRTMWAYAQRAWTMAEAGWVSAPDEAVRWAQEADLAAEAAIAGLAAILCPLVQQWRREHARRRRRWEERAARRREDQTGAEAGGEARARADATDPRVSAAILGVELPVSQEALRAAHRRAVLEHHPDRGGDTKKMVDVNLAYENLLNTAGAVVSAPPQ